MKKTFRWELFDSSAYLKFTVLGLFLFLVACKEEASNSKNNPTALTSTELKHRSPKPAVITFKKTKIQLGPKTLTVEVADTEEKRARGLMFRTQLEKDHGMLFIFDDEQPLSFWMKNTFLPLSIGFFDKNKVLIDIQDMQPVKSIRDENPDRVSSKKPAQYALEVPQGWFKENKIEVGMRFDVKK